MRLRSAVLTLSLCAFVLAPSQAIPGISIIQSLTHERLVEPGGTYTGTIAVKNIGAYQDEAEVYPADYLFFRDGTHIYGEPGTDPRSNADWITFGPRRLSILPGATAIINYTIEVPEDESLTGTYWSLLMVEDLAGGAPDVSGDGTDQVSMGINQVFRYAIQIVVHVGDTGQRTLEFLDTKLLTEGDQKILQIDMGNNGERWLRPVLWTEVYDMDGGYIGRFDGGKLRIYPGTSVRYRVDMSELASADYNAVVVADCGGEDVFGAKYTLRVEK